jgi:putative ABC transport system permease protein
MVNLLDRKLRRDLRQLRGPMATIGLVMACGIAAFLASLGTHASLVEGQRDYYAQAQFADVFCALKRAPERLAPRLAALPGVAALETRLVCDAPLHVEDMSEQGTARLISLPEGGGPQLNRLHLRSGRYPEPGSSNEALVSEGFSHAHGLAPGGRMEVLLHGRQARLNIVGVALSPEYLYAVPGGDPIPDDRHFAVVWIPRKGLEAAYDLAGAFNSVVITLTQAAAEGEVLDRIDRLLAPYGGLGAHGRTDLPSHRFVTDEIHQQRTMAIALPSIFLGVAAFLIHVVMARLVASQRQQIAALKALGFPDLRIAMHFLKLACLVCVFGLALGLLLGAWMGSAMTNLYADYLRFPRTEFRLHALHVILASAICLTAVAGGTLVAARQVLRLTPAEALRPPVPPRFHRGWLETWHAIRALPSSLRMILRNLIRRPLRSALSTLGISLGVAILVVGLFWRDGLDNLIQVQFGLAQRQDMTVAFTEPLPESVSQELSRFPGVLGVEPFRMAAVRLRHGHRQSRAGLIGLDSSQGMQRVLDAEHQAIPAPAGGLMISESLAHRLDARVGDDLDVEVLEGKRRSGSFVVAALSPDLMGLAAYLDQDLLLDFLDEGRVMSAANVRLSARGAESLHALLKTRPKVASVSAKAAAMKSFLSTSAQFVAVFSLFLTGFAAVIAVGVVYNNVRIALAERAWELASLQVLGFTRREVSTLLLGEFAVQLVGSLPLGCGLGYLLAKVMLWATATESFRIPLVVAPRTYLFACVTVLAAGALSAWGARRRLDRLDLVAVLKERE